MPRQKKKPNKQHGALLTERPLIAPKSPAQARKYLREVAKHLSSYPNGLKSFRFVAAAIRRYLNRPQDGLIEALCLVPRQTPRKKSGNQPISLKAVFRISKMLAAGADVPAILKSVSVKQKTVERVQSAYHKVFLTVRNNDREEDGDVPMLEWNQVVRKASEVNSAWRAAIIRGALHARRNQKIS